MMAKRRPKPKDKQSCGTCRFYGPRRATDGDCFRFPYKVPQTPEGWCGEYRAKPKAEDGERITE